MEVAGDPVALAFAALRQPPLEVHVLGALGLATAVPLADAGHTAAEESAHE